MKKYIIPAVVFVLAYIIGYAGVSIARAMQSDDTPVAPPAPVVQKVAEPVKETLPSQPSQPVEEPVEEDVVPAQSVPVFTSHKSVLTSKSSPFTYSITARATCADGARVAYRLTTNGNGSITSDTGNFENLSPGRYTVTAYVQSHPDSKATWSVNLVTPASTDEVQSALNSGRQYADYADFFESKFVNTRNHPLYITITDVSDADQINNYRTVQELMRQVRNQIWESISVKSLQYNESGLVTGITVSYVKY